MKLKTNTPSGKRPISYYAFALLICFILCRGTLITYITATLNKLPVLNFFTPVFTPIAFCVLVVLAYKRKLCTYLRGKDFFVVLFLIVALMLTIILYPENEEFIWQNFGYYIVYCIPAFFIGLFSVEYDEDMFRFISIISCVSLVFSFLMLFYYTAVGNLLSGDELGQSYSVLLSTLFIIAYYFYKRSSPFLVLSILGVIYALVLGSRGPIILIFVFIAWNLINRNKKRWYVIALFAVMLYVFFNFGYYIELLKYIQGFLNNIGYSTRIVDLALKNELFSHDSGRNNLYVTLLDLLQERPFVGYGLFGEWRYIGWNAHQLYLEVVFEYGWPLGIILIIGYVCRVLIAYAFEKDETCKYFMMILIVFVLIQGFKSYSHLRPELFLLLGFCIKQRRIQKRVIHYK